MAFLGLANFPLVVINLLFIPLWIILKIRYALLGIIVLLIGYPFVERQMSFHFSIIEAGADSTAEVMSFNSKLFGLYDWKRNTENRNEVFKFLKKENPDILCIQEFFYEEKDYFETKDTMVTFLKAKNAHFEAASSLHKTHHWGVATFSRYPIVNKGKIKFEKTKGNICIYTDIVKDEDTLRVYNVHFQSNMIDEKTIDGLSSGDSTSKLSALKVFFALRSSYQKRAKQVDAVVSSMQKCPYKMIVCGDFNDVPMSYCYQKVSDGLVDAFLNAGTGFGFTYAGKLPFLRIDYIFHSPEIRSYDFKVLKKVYSDHYPVSCRIAI